MYDEDELLPLSGLQHLVYCERQWALIHLEQLWAENRLTVEGRQLHERTDELGRQSRRDVRIVRGLSIHSLRLGLSGRADTVEFHRIDNASSELGVPCEKLPVAVRLPGDSNLWRPFPVEYKRGRSKRSDCDRVQLCAQALCLEEMLSVSVPGGALFYGRTRRREDVALDAGLRDQTEQLAQRMHDLFRAGKTPRMVYDSKRCDRCSLYSKCEPKTTGAHRSVERYLSEASEAV